MPIPPAGTRQPAINRQLITIPRTSILTRPNDGRARTVLDTGILISALMAKKRGHPDSASYQIIESYKADKFILLVHANLLTQYDKKLNEIVKESSSINSEDVGVLLNLIRAKEKQFFPRLLVEVPIQTPRGYDDLLFDGINMSADYIVTLDAKYRKKHKAIAKAQGIDILLPNDFLRKVLKRLLA